MPLRQPFDRISLAFQLGHVRNLRLLHHPPQNQRTAQQLDLSVEVLLGSVAIRFPLFRKGHERLGPFDL